MIEYTKDKPLRVIELFCGYGAQRISFERLKRQFPEFDYKVVAVSEIDKYAIKAYEAIHGDCPNLGDICDIDWTKAPDCDLITWSFPCTSLSSAGLQAGMKEGSGTASSLGWEALKAIRIKRPRYALMENVPALLSKKFKPEFLRLESELSSYGYTNFVKICGAQDYGVPQHRDRVFMVSILNENAHYYFPKPFPLTKRLKDVLEDEVDESYYLSDERVQGLIASTLKQQNKGNGFKFEPKTPEQIATTVQASGCNRKTDNFVVCGAIRGRKDTPEDSKHRLELETNSPDVSNTITSVAKDNVVILGNNPEVANTVTAHYAKEKTSDLVRNTFGGGSYVMQKLPPKS